MTDIAVTITETPAIAVTITETPAIAVSLSTGVLGTYILVPAFNLAPTPQTGSATPIAAGANLTPELIVPIAGTIIKAVASAKTGPTGADLIFDLNVNGTSIWAATQANRLKIVAAATSGSQTSFDTTALVAGDKLSIDVDQIGSTIAGQDITVQLTIAVKAT